MGPDGLKRTVNPGHPTRIMEDGPGNAGFSGRNVECCHCELNATEENTPTLSIRCMEISGI